jgi:hypothetical protein
LVKRACDKKDLRSVFTVVARWAFSLVMSVYFLEPVAEKHGMMGTIGARVSRTIIGIGIAEILDMLQQE